MTVAPNAVPEADRAWHGSFELRFDRCRLLFIKQKGSIAYRAIDPSTRIMD